MGSFMKELAAKFNLESNGTQAWGLIEGYWFQITPPAYGRNFLRVQTAVHLSDEAGTSTLASGLADMVTSTPAISYNRNEGTITLDRKMPFSGFKTEDVESMLLQMVSIFRKAAAVPGCFNCNSERLDSFAMVNGMAMKLCAQCQADISQTITAQTQEYSETKNNFVRGILGAVIGALVGSIVWVVIGLLGYFAAIGGVAISFCSAKGYTMMKGKINIPSIIIICLICIAALVFAQFTTETIGVLDEAGKAGYQIGIGEAAQFTYDVILNEPEVTSGFVKNLLFGLLFLALGSYSTVRSLFVSAKAPAGTFERM